MDGWLIVLLMIGLAVLALRLWTGPAPHGSRDHHPEGPPLADEPLWTADALARLGTPETVADLVAQGRADELRGLGYRGELPPEK